MNQPFRIIQSPNVGALKQQNGKDKARSNMKQYIFTFILSMEQIGTTCFLMFFEPGLLVPGSYAGHKRKTLLHCI